MYLCCNETLLNPSFMRKGIFIMALLFVGCLYAQEQTEPQLEKVGTVVKATYFHDNGEIAQTGYLLKGRLHGQWFKYDKEGKKIASGKYVDGKRSGKWFFWTDEVLKEVDFIDNRIAYVKNWNQSEVVSVH